MDILIQFVQQFFGDNAAEMFKSIVILCVVLNGLWKLLHVSTLEGKKFAPAISGAEHQEQDDKYSKARIMGLVLQAQNSKTWNVWYLLGVIPVPVRVIKLDLNHERTRSTTWQNTFKSRLISQRFLYRTPKKKRLIS